MKAVNKIEWKGHTIEFIPVLSHRYFWIATANELWFDGNKVATSGGLCFSSKAKATIQHDGIPVAVEMRSSSSFSFSINLNYELLIDQKIVSKGLAKTHLRW